MAEYAKVIVDISQEKLDKTFEYRIPPYLTQRIAVGMQVYIPFGSRRITGYVVELSDEAEYGDAAKTVLNAWAKNCKGIYRENGSLIDPNELLIAIQAYQLANAAEILRGYDNWGDTEEFKAFVQWMENTFYAMADDFLIRHNNTTDHYWLNWDLAQMTAILSIGILSDNQEMINKVIQYFKNGIGPGNVDMAVFLCMMA